MPMLIVAATTGCGGGSGGETYSLSASQPCLAHLGDLSNYLDSIAEEASGGAKRLVIDGKEVMVVFGRESSEAKRIAEAYGAVPGGVGDRRSNNVVMAWTDEPSSDEAEAVEDCLS